MYAKNVMINCSNIDPSISSVSSLSVSLDSLLDRNVFGFTSTTVDDALPTEKTDKKKKLSLWCRVLKAPKKLIKKIFRKKRTQK